MSEQVDYDQIAAKYPKDKPMMDQALKTATELFNLDKPGVKEQLLQLRPLIAEIIDDSHSIMHRGGFSRGGVLSSNDYSLDVRIATHAALRNSGFGLTSDLQESLSHVWGAPTGSRYEIPKKLNFIEPERMNALIRQMLGSDQEKNLNAGISM